ncbi:OmpH family outer membrane protein [Chitinispirillales bacterium ANBcel5]|uniref:OmpH family outer membrane protein n=1 Tax=Cellulosispirillum alkaliphilum TaxID=3039283 RepID=UPI002A537A15|nr:OmpH family outer membrane protein [Chitinispirillales bacterium ANBcel5]
MNRRLILKGIVLVLAAVSVATAQMKIGFIDSERIFLEYHGTESAQKQFNEEVAKWEQEASRRQKELRELQEQLEGQSLLLSSERKQELENELRQKMMAYQEFLQQKFGERGEALMKNEQLTGPIIEKINVIIQKIAEDENYDYILDARAGGIIHAKSAYDLSDTVIRILNEGN